MIVALVTTQSSIPVLCLTMGYRDPERQRQYQRERAARFRSEYLFGKYCVKCGSTERLEIDHINPATKIDNAIWSWSKVRREAELAKCQVLCHDCHLLKTKSELSRDTPHGVNRYKSRRHRCRCDICREAHRIQAAQRRAGLL